MSDRVTKTAGALYGVAVARKRRRCDGHLADGRHFIEPGQRYVASALPPSAEIGNDRWWHMSLCAGCAPVEYSIEATR